jgi:hypothetical protein
MTIPTTRAAMTCAQFEALLGDLLDDTAGTTVDAAVRAECGRHRATCPACAALLADVRAITAAAATLPPPAPSQDLWHAIAARLETPVVSMDRAPSPKRAALPWRRMAAAAVLLMSVSAGATWMVARRAPAPAPVAVRHAPAVALDSLYGREIAVLRDAADGALGQLDSATAAVVRRNLAIIDQAIRESRAALAADPQSGFLLEQLDHAYGRKVGLLRRLTLL